MTPVEKYIARLYEQAVDAQLDVEAIRQHLTDNGIRRTPAQLLHDLDFTYGFVGYADSHPAPVTETAAELDARIGT